MLNEFFSTCFNTAVPPLSMNDDDFTVQNDRCPEELLCSAEEILYFIMSMDLQKANGPDGISAKMLKGVAYSITPSLTRLFNISIVQGRVPECWKSSSVVPIPKSTTNRKNANNYRPISLLSIGSKLLERHFYHHITNVLNKFRPLCNIQWGFQDGKSTVTALLNVTHDWLKVLEDGKEVCSVFFDLKKAFDTVPHSSLMQKLSTYGLDNNTLSWVCSYLTNRKQHVVVGGESSQDTTVLFGVPQGSVLGPLLFLIYIDDVSGLVLSAGSTLNLYADDMLLYKPVGRPEDFNHLQIDIDHIKVWVSNNHLALNSDKYKVMMISRKRNPVPPPQFILQDTPLKQVEDYRYLGVLTSDLSWSSHTQHVPKLENSLDCFTEGSMVTWIIRAYLNSIIYLCVLTWIMPLLSGIHTLSKTLQNWSLFRNLH